MRATLQDEAAVKAAGYKVTADYGGYLLIDPDGSPLLIGLYGCVSPTRWEAVAEGLARIDQDR